MLHSSNVLDVITPPAIPLLHIDSVAAPTLPMSLEYIVHAMDSGNITTMGRSVDQLMEYRAWQTDIKAKYHSVPDFVAYNVFAYPTSISADGKICCPIPGVWTCVYPMALSITALPTPHSRAGEPPPTAAK